MSLRVKVLPAFNGDSILISFGPAEDTKNILIDGGIGRTYPRVLKQELETIIGKGQSIDLLVITHIDDDHIAGVIKLFEDVGLDKSFIREVWFNSGELLEEHFGKSGNDNRVINLDLDPSTEISLQQGITLETVLNQLGCWRRELIKDDNTPYELHGAKITVLSPNLATLQNLHQYWSVESDEDIEIAAGEAGLK